MDTLKLRVSEEVFEIDLSETTSPDTLEILKAFLPFRVDLRYAKIAGEEVMGMMPFYAPLEREIQVFQARSGMLAYYPPRQLLCLYYGQIQPEAAQISVLGYLKGDLPTFKRHGERVREDLGKKLHYCDLFVDLPDDDLNAACPKHAFLDPYERDIWFDMPEEIRRIRRQRAIMQPVGPILYAEGDTRICHEFLTAAFDKAPADSRDLRPFKSLLCESLGFFYNKIKGWYGLDQAGAVIHAYMRSFEECDSVQSIASLLGSVMLFVGRLNMWLDALIPWSDINENLKTRVLE